jgi:RNA polymerase sigma-70 factor (ECF subfamily)
MRYHRATDPRIPVTNDPTPNVALQALVDNHRRFLDFLERRTGNRADAEDVLQGAFVRALEKGEELRDGESAVAWLFRLLRNALVDRARAGMARDRALEGRAEGDREREDDELEGEVCRCVAGLLPTLKSEYAELLRRVDLDGEAVHGAAQALGITPNNAGVRLHRARKALLREVQRSCRTCATHGCLDCSCGQPEAATE